jgi:fermentation-respiration switch protein FrsA (DUF1100 family)
LYEHGFATLRINMYDTKPGTRDMIDCTMETHAQDSDAVVSYVRARNPPAVMAAGHSYGGLTILSSTAKLDAAVLWEPSHFKCSYEYDLRRWQGRHALVKNTPAIAYLKGSACLDPLPMAEERERKMLIPESEIATKPYPLLFIGGAESPLAPYLRKYYKAASEPKKLVIVPGATHDLTDTDEILFEVFDETLQWLQKQLHREIAQS